MSPNLKLPCCDDTDEMLLCFQSDPLTLNTIRRLFTVLLRTVFKQSNRLNGFEEKLKCYVYDDDKSKSEISIQPGSVLDPGDTNNVPGLLIKLAQGIEYYRQSITTEAHESKDTSSKRLINMAKANVNIVCRDRDADIACSLSDLVILIVIALTPKLHRIFPELKDVQVTHQTDADLAKNPANEADTWYESVATIQLQFYVDVTCVEESPRLKNASVVANTND